ncbi:abnormal spindle-like microcephaly-associated protein homolog [Ylistrum balloti]|uniref:abnormal spindle-like microcephaly-associated protein homolog n=1 Tax=Ylistrum balloti TaxID=509963 RepID=UPI002905B10A|nr:abnormal spindle-like microcephaly-associated protein homolog [Ylistrum balloti]
MDIGDHTGTLSLRQDDALENFGPIAFTTSTPSNPTRRSGRKSWFDNLGNAGKGTKYEIAVEKTVKRRSVCRRKSEDDDIETLTLTHFTNPPRISFGRAKPGTIKRRSLLIKNPHEHSQDVVVEKFPFKKHFDIDETKFTVEAEGTLLLTITWSPEDEGNFREMILLHVDGSYRLQAFVFGTVEKPPQKKKVVGKGLMGKATKKPFAVIHTTSLANIAKSYSPTKGEARKSGEGRKRLSKGRENKVSVKKTQVKQDNSYPKPKQHSAQVTEFVDGGLDSNIKISHITPIKPVEDPVISAAEFVVPKVVKMPGKSSVNKLQGDFQEELECLSPLVAKYLDNSDDDVIVVRQTVNSEDQKNQLNTPDRMMLASNKISSSTTHDTPKSTVQVVEPHKNKLNTSNKVDVVERKTPDKENQWFDQEGKADALSPNSFLQDSLCSQRGVDTSLYDAVSTISRQPAHSTILPTPERMSCANQHKDFISPNKFLKELNDTQERLELSLQHDPDTILSPESILNSSIPHAIMVKQLQTVKMSLASPNPPVFSPMSNKRETFVLKSNLSINQSPALRRETFLKGRTVTKSKPFPSSSRNALFTQQGKQKTNTKKKDTKPRVDSNNLRKKSKEDCENLYKKTNCENGKFSQDWINGVSSSKAIPVSPLPTNIPSTGIHQGAINTPELLLNSQAITDSVSLKTTDGNTLSGKTFTPSGVVSLNTKSTILETPANLTVDTPVAEMLSVRVPAISMQLPCDIRTGKHDRMSQDSLEGSVLAIDSTTVMKEKTLNDITPERQTSTGKRLLTPENEVSPPQDYSFQSPSNLPEDTPMREVFTRRTTLTVTKEKPSDALLQVTKKHISSQLNTEDKAITSDNTVHNLTNGSPRLHTAVPEENPERCISILLRNSTTSHPVEHTPTDVSVRSIDNKTSSFTTTPHQLPTSPNPDNSRRSTHVIEKPKVLDLSIIGRKRLFPPLEDSADESVTQKDNLTTVTVAATSSTLDVVPVQLATDHSDNLTLDISRHTKQASEEKSQDEGIPSNDEVSLKSDLGKSCVPDIGDEEKQKVDITSVKQSPDKMVTISQERKPYVAFITGSPVDPPSKQPRVTNRTKEIVKKRTHSENRAVDRVDNKRLRSTGTINTGMSGRSQTVSSLSHSTTRPRPATASKRDNKTGGPLRTSSKFKSSLKGVAQTKLILMKKSHPTALPKHPMPFASKNMYYDERWIDKQERGFVHWLNFVLTPAEEYQHSNKQVKVDAGALSVEASRASVKLAPSKEVLSIRAYTARRRLNQLRRGACNLFQTKEIICVIQKLEAEIESLRLVIRKDKKVHADLGMKQDILDMILSFNPLWLRIGLETVYGEMIPMQNNTDVISMSRFIVTRLLSNPDIASEYCHPTVPHLYRDGYAEAIAQHLLKKVFMLIYFLDKAKSHRLINHDPCLFCKDSEFKSTKAMLIQFSRNYLSGEGDVTKHLGYLGYVVTHQQTSMDEFDYAVTNLATDLRDGVRLTRVLELLTNHWDLSRSLRAPAISRLQKVHNMEVVFKALTTQGVTFDKEKKITTKDIVDGHREKTLHVLWALILQYQVDVLLNKENLREEINILQRSLYVRNQLAALQRYEQGLSKKRRESSEQDLHLQSDSLLLLLRWCRTVCAFYNIKIENFTVSFGDGRAMCALVHHYHPALLPWNSINTKTTLTYQDTLDEEMCSRNQDLNSSEVFSPAPFPVAEDPVLFEEFLSNEKANFKLLYEKVSELGGIPLMLRSMDMSNTIPDEKVVVTYICYLCARLLDIRHESRAARVIQLAWRRHYLRKSKKELQSRKVSNSYVELTEKGVTHMQCRKMKHDAAIVIQRAARRFLSSRQAVRRNEGAKVIQKHVRVWLARRTIAQLRAAKEERCRTNAACVLQVAVRKWLKKQMTKKETAAVRIQAAWRCHRERKRFRQIKSACVIIQNQARMYLQRSRYGKVRQAVICIQRRYRAHHSMTSHRKEFLQIRSAAITIQSRYQSLVQRRLFLRLRASAVKIQATVRTWIDRRRYLSLRLATINIQRHYRARQKSAEVRKEFLLQKQAAVLIQAHFRSYTVRKNRKRLHAAAVVIQSRFKGLHDRKRYLKVRSAVVTLQRWIRAVTQGRKARSDFKKVRSSVVKIQSVYRSHRARSDFLTKRSAAITLQAHIRGHQKMEAFKKLKAAAINIQRRFRAQREGERVRRQFLVQKGATMTIQAFYRGHKVRQHIKCQHLAATKIQAVFKGHVQRNIFLRVRKAALIIQQKVRAKFEGNIVRKEFLIKKGAAMTIQAHFRGHMIRKNIKRLHAAAVVIQSHFKGLQDRKRYLRVRSAVVTLQRWTRAITQSRKARSEFEKVRSSVVKIQSVYRSHRARSDFLTKRSAAITIQAHIRGHQKMEAFRKLKAAAVNVQRRFRAHREGERVRRQFLVQKGATMTIQAFYRGHKVRQHIKCQHSSATKIQAVFKGHVQRNMFLRVRKAALIIQQKVRATFEGNRVREEFLTKKSAVLTIQAYFRGHVVRQEVATMNSAASMIQSKVKGYLQRKRFLRLKGAVLVIQQRFAAQLAGRRLRQEFLVRKGAAMTIQAAYRGYTVRKELDRYNNAAVILQSFYRAHRATTLYKQQRTASIHIQQWYRNLMFTRQIKAEYFRMRAAAVTIQAWYRCHKAVQALKMDKSRVITAQAVVRGFLQRRRFVKLCHAAVLIQRRFVARRQCINMRRAFLIKKGAAMTIQAAFRGHLVRRGLKRMHAAAVVIQSSYRTHQAVLSYSKQRKAVTTIQSWYRNWLYSRTVRSDYLSKKNAAVVIQKHYRCFLARRIYLRELSNIILVQALVRGVLQRIAFRRLQWAVTVCQTQYRSMLASHQQRCWFQNLRSAAIVFQSAWRKRRAQMMYIKTRQAVILLQSHVRMIQERKHFCQLKAVTIRCQKLVRSKRQMQECRKDYLITLGAVITIQAHVKSYLVQKQYHATLRSVICIQAHVRRFLAQRQYRKVYNNVVAVQTRFKANIAAKKQRSLFLVQRKAAIVIQTAFRKQQARRHMQRVRSAIVIQKIFRMFVTRQDFMRQKNAAIVLQSHHRACIARREKERRKLAVVSLQRAMRMFLFRQRLRQWMQRRNEAAMKIQCCLRGYLARRWVRKTKSAIVIQSVYRMYHQRNLYRRTTKSIVLLQSALRGTLARRRVNHTRTQHSAATCIQNAYRSFKRRQAEQVLRRRRMRYLHKFSEVVSAHLSAMKIQRCYRNYRVLLVAQQRLNTIIIIQRWMKAKLARMRFLRFVSAVRVVQARARQYLHLRQASVIKLQAVVRSWLARRWIVRREESVIKLQSIWRGRKVRKAYRSKKFETIRKNLKEATKSATEDRKLGNRTESALDYLLKYKQLSQILEALIHLETSTRLSPACCQRMVNVNAVGVIYRLIQSCNRSQPHMEIIRYSINILLNLAKYEKTRSAVYEVEGATECLLELMQVYREKGHIFSCSCTLMGILGMMDDKKQMVLADKKMTGKILSIYTLTSRKHKITENRMIRQAKISAAKSFNASLPILTLQKRQNRIHPDWVLQRNQMRHIEDPLQAIKFVLDNFQLTPK